MPTRASRASVLHDALPSAALLLAISCAACTPVLENERYSCDPQDPASCPEGFACLSLGPKHLCFSSWTHECDNQVVEPEEQCDTDNFGGGDATSFGCQAGDTLYCLERVCRVYCTRCGNGRVELTPSGEGEQCDDGNLVDGDGCSSTCRLETCGNGVVDPNEDCDDGNLAPGDGCSPACRLEECGNGIIDYETGEHCDDGNPLSQDGCASNCTVEFPTWTRWTSPLETPREFHAMAFDEARGRLVLFGGKSGEQWRGDTWEHDGERWLQIRTASSPSPRQAHALAYDPVGQRILLVGGLNPDRSGIDDLWSYNGEDWTLLSPEGGGPGPRGGAAVSWDVTLDRLVLFSGVPHFDHEPIEDTWVFDGVGWTALSPAASPGARAGAALASDPVRGCLVLFGGHDLQSMQPTNDTWELWGDVWTEQAPTRRPGARSLHSLSWHGGLEGVVVYGGFDYVSTIYEDTWIYDGTDWTLLSPDATPMARAGHAAAWIAPTGRLLIHGGTGALGLADSWALDNIGWRQVLPSFAPPYRIEAAATYDRRRGQLVLFGGYDGLDPGNDTWEFDGDTWSPRATGAEAIRPPVRRLAALAFDEARGVTVLFGGRGGEGTVLDDTWAFDGQGWRALAPPHSPTGRCGHAMVFDPTRARVLLHGGTDDQWHFFSDTWELDLATETWSLVPTPVFPSARHRASLTWDRSREAAVLFGGNLPSEMLNDTWFFRDGGWEPLVSDRKPTARAHAALTFDESRRRVLLFGGSYDFSYPGQSGLSDTWELREDGWYRLNTVNAPAPRESMTWAWDAQRRRTLLVGGIPGADEVWELRYQGFTPLEDCGNALDDDGDTLVDCLDPDCAWDAACGATP